MYKSVEVDVDIDIDDVLDFISTASNQELQKIKEDFPELVDDTDFKDYEILKVESLYDREKSLILKKAMEKYNLNELMERLDISQGDAM